MTNTALTIRRATAADAFALRRLAAIDSAAASMPMDSAHMAQMRLDSLRADSLHKDSVAKGLIRDTAAAPTTP